VSLESLHSLKISQVPNVDKVISESMTCENFVVLFGKQQIANLTIGLMLSDHFPFTDVPESYFLVCSASASGQQIGIVAGPRQSLNCRLVRFFQNWNIRFCGKDKKLVIISA
jgi:hypothetical protein